MTDVPRSLVFRREREASWAALEVVVDRAERDGVRALDPQSLIRLPSLYRDALSSLAVARSISLDLNLLEYLETLVDRAYLCVYGTRRGAGEALATFFLERFPQTFRRFGRPILLASALLILSTAAGFALTVADEARFLSFVSPEVSEGRGPDASTEDLRKILYSEREGDHGALSFFASYLFTHNAKIGMTCFGLGVFAGLPVFFLLLSNGLLLGAMAGLYQHRGLGLDFWAWVLPHGITELGSIALCGGAGLALAQAFLFPSERRRLDSVARCGREGAVLVLGAVSCLFVAACIEGVFRQLVHSIPIRLAVASLTLVAWASYFGYFGRAGRRAS